MAGGISYGFDAMCSKLHTGYCYCIYPCEGLGNVAI